MAAGEASAGVVWAAVGAIGVIHEDDMATGEWGFLKGLLQELAPVAGPLGGERAVRERLAAAATRWRARLSQAMDAAAAAIQKDFEVSGGAGGWECMGAGLERRCRVARDGYAALCALLLGGLCRSLTSFTAVLDTTSTHHFACHS